MLLAPVAVASRSLLTERLAEDAPLASILQLTACRSPPLKLLAPLALTVRFVAVPPISATEAPLRSKPAFCALTLPLKLLAPLSEIVNDVPFASIFPFEAPFRSKFKLPPFIEPFMLLAPERTNLKSPTVMGSVSSTLHAPDA